MAQLQALVGSQIYNLHDVDADLVWIEDDGWGMAPVKRITDRGPLQHGDSDNDFRLEPRIGMLKLLAQATDASDHWDVRTILRRIFRPSNTAIRLLWTLDNGDVRQIDVHYAGGLTFPSQDRIGFSQKAIVQLRAADPTFYDPSQQAVTYGVGSGSGGFVFPLVFPVSFGGSTVNQSRAITYLGEWRDYPIVLIKGPITNPVITNVTTGDKLDLTGTTVANGDTYTIDCRPGRKTVVDASGVDKIATLSDDSDLQTFSLEADPEAVDGINVITVTGTSANATTDVFIRYLHRFLGI